MADNHNVDVGHLATRLLNLTLPMGLVLDEVLIQGENVRFERKPFRIDLPEPGSLEVRLSERGLGEFLNAKAPGGLSGFKITFADNQIHVEAKASLIISLNVRAVCGLRIEDESDLIVELIRMDSIGGTGAHNIVQKHLDGINPIVKTKDLPVDVRFTGVEIANEWLVLRGTISPREE